VSSFLLSRFYPTSTSLLPHFAEKKEKKRKKRDRKEIERPHGDKREEKWRHQELAQLYIWDWGMGLGAFGVLMWCFELEIWVLKVLEPFSDWDSWNQG
jgi:hypothetical protein